MASDDTVELRLDANEEDEGEMSGECIIESAGEEDELLADDVGPVVEFKKMHEKA